MVVARIINLSQRIKHFISSYKEVDMNLKENMRIVDLSMPIEDHWRFPLSRISKYTARPQFVFHTTEIKIMSHGFSHVDAPFHVDRNMTTIDNMGLEPFWGSATVVDLSDLGDNAEINREVLESKCAQVQAGDIVLLRSDQELRHPTTTKEYWTVSPWVSLSGARYLRELKVKATAFDFPQDRSIRAAYDPNYLSSEDVDEDEACHLELLRFGIPQFEYLSNFRALRQKRFIFFGLPLKITGCDGSPIRAVALEA